MNELEKKRVEHAVAAFIARRRPPAHLRDKLDLVFRFDGRTVEIFEICPRFDKPSEKIEHPVAKARYFKSSGLWAVYWQRADLKWHRYPKAPEVGTIEAFLKLVDEDEYACFFG